jgi:hypothetical protein
VKPKQVYVVMRTQGEYGDRREWPVVAYTKEKKAQQRVVVDTAKAREKEGPAPAPFYGDRTAFYYLVVPLNHETSPADEITMDCDTCVYMVKAKGEQSMTISCGHDPKGIAGDMNRLNDNGPCVYWQRKAETE